MVHTHRPVYCYAFMFWKPFLKYAWNSLDLTSCFVLNFNVFRLNQHHKYTVLRLIQSLWILSIFFFYSLQINFLSQSTMYERMISHSAYFLCIIKFIVSFSMQLRFWKIIDVLKKLLHNSSFMVWKSWIHVFIILKMIFQASGHDNKKESKQEVHINSSDFLYIKRWICESSLLPTWQKQIFYFIVSRPLSVWVYFNV